MLRILLLPMLLIAACASTRESARYDFSALDARLDRECLSGAFSGVVVVQVKSREVYNKICGHAEGEPIERSDRFKIYSTSKLLTAVTIMRLVELGRMNLDSSVATYLPDVPSTWRGVTIRHLLQHTSGLPDLTNQLFNAVLTREDHQAAMRVVLAAAADSALKPTTAPGAKWSYNNFGYELLADAGARVEGRPFHAVLQAHLLSTAGMKRAVVDQAVRADGKVVSAPVSDLVPGYNGRPDSLARAVSYSFVQLGAGAVIATVDDMLAFERALRRGDVVSKRTWQQMVDARVPISDDTTRAWGLGVRLHNLDGMRMETHSGGNNGYVANFVRYPDFEAVQVVLANRGFVQPGWLAEAAGRALQKGR